MWTRPTIVRRRTSRRCKTCAGSATPARLDAVVVHIVCGAWRYVERGGGCRPVIKEVGWQEKCCPRLGIRGERRLTCIASWFGRLTSAERNLETFRSPEPATPPSVLTRTVNNGGILSPARGKRANLSLPALPSGIPATGTAVSPCPCRPKSAPSNHDLVPRLCTWIKTDA